MSNFQKMNSNCIPLFESLFEFETKSKTLILCIFSLEQYLAPCVIFQFLLVSAKRAPVKGKLPAGGVKKVHCSNIYYYERKIIGLGSNLLSF